MKNWIEENQEVLEKIRNKANEIHQSVNQKYDDYDYIHHLDMVFDEALKIDWPKIANPITIIASCYFHDTIEDARLTYHDVENIIYDLTKNHDIAFDTAEIVYALTNEKGRTRKERANEKYYEGIRDTEFATEIKVCDRLANMKYSKQTGSRMFGVYMKELDEFLKCLGITDSHKLYNHIQEQLNA